MGRRFNYVQDSLATCKIRCYKCSKILRSKDHYFTINNNTRQTTIPRVWWAENWA